MAYDPQANHRRPKPDDGDPAPIDALLGASGGDPTAPAPDDPPPEPAVTPAPADPPSDTLLVSSGVISAVGGIMALMILRHLWKRRQQAEAPE